MDLSLKDAVLLLFDNGKIVLDLTSVTDITEWMQPIKYESPGSYR